ncbi:MAG: FtsX-like permease family protein [Candidatus Hydrogenedentes bacterium]|nr:FtsX-like permease family protein [Candidatus Hydrogenedentota bacterium]
MKRLRHILGWALFGLVVIVVQYAWTKWLVESEKDPDLQETVQFRAEDYPRIAAQITVEGLERHIRALSSIPSRLTGTVGCDQAAQYILEQFRALGVGEPHVEEFPVIVPVHTRAELRTKHGVFPIHPLYPNGICPAAVAADGLQTHLVYGGFGSLAEVEGKELDGATVVVEANTREQWIYLIDLGARAIIFVEHDRPERELQWFTQTRSHQNVPRFWMTRREATPLLASLRENEIEATLLSDARWETRTGRNLWIEIPGRSQAEHNREEFVVLEAYYDSASLAPDLAPGAEQSCGIAALLELAPRLKEYPLEKRVRLLATSGHFQALEGIRQYVWRNVGQYGSPLRDVSPQGHAAFLGLDLSSGTGCVGLFCAGHFFKQQSLATKPRLSDLGLRASRYSKEIAQALHLIPELSFADTLNQALGKDWVTYLPSEIALDHEVALLPGIPALSFVTTNDMRSYSATPTDAVVNVENLVQQVRVLACLIPNAFNVEGRYVKRSLPQSMSRVGGRVVSFDPKRSYLPDKPVEHALVMARRQIQFNPFLSGVAAYPLAMTDSDGQFSVAGLLVEDQIWSIKSGTAFEAFVVQDGGITWAPDFGQLGKENYPITLIPVQKEMKLMCVAFPCRTLDLYNLVDPRNFNYLTHLDVIESASNSRPPVYGTTVVDPGWLTFISPTASIFVPPGADLKVTAGAGPGTKRMLLLNMPESAETDDADFPTGHGFDVAESSAIRNMYLQSAQDMWRLDESRIRFFGAHGIENARVSKLHEEAGHALNSATEALSTKRYQEYSVEARRALSLESRAYPDVLGMANDTVRGLIFYLALLLPFAFTMERLFLAGRRIETRILGIVAFFVGMFFILRLTHPAFQIVLSPMVVLLGFCIAVLSLVVISIVMTRLETLVSKRKVEQSGEHESGVQALSGFALALEMGIANMRRRKARTVLTSVTLVVLTFSVLSFVSVTAQIRFQQYRYEEGATPYQGILLRNRNWAPFPFETYASLRNELQATCTLAPRVWYYGALVLNYSSIEIQKGDTLRQVKALVGLTPQERSFMDVDSALLGKSRWLSEVSSTQEPPPEILLPYTVAAAFVGSDAPAATDSLTAEQKAGIISPLLGQQVRVLGRLFTVVGVFDEDRMNQLVDIDGEPLTPFDPIEMEKKAQEEGTPDPEVVQRYIHHSFRDVAIVPEKELRHSGVRSIGMLPRQPSDVGTLAHSLVNRLDYILFANIEGAPTLLSSRNATRIADLWHLMVLIAIAGLIVFNTMLGSVYERTKEIGTYTALGIAPSHIGRLFLVEAGVFAIIGIMAGYVLGQSVARASTTFEVPLLSTLNLNYSSLAGVGACAIVMAMVLLSSVYPSRKASELGVPEIERRWKLPPTEGTELTLDLPFTVSPHEAPGLVAFLKEYLDSHVDVSVGDFYVENVVAGPGATGNGGTGITGQFWLTPLDLGVSQYTTIVLSNLEGLDMCGVRARIERLSGDAGSWRRANSRFMTALRSQFLIWRNLTPPARAEYVARGKEYAIV